MKIRPAKKVYDFYSRFYDLLFGKILEEGRKKIFKTGSIEPHSRVLEIGVGTGLTLKRYPKGCSVHALDISAEMLKQAQRRISRRPSLKHRRIALLNGDAANLPYKCESFDTVVASYVLTTVEEPRQVLREMARVAKKSGRILVVNHFLGDKKLLRRLERALSPVFRRIGFRTDLDLASLIEIEGIQKEKEMTTNPFRLYKVVQLKKENCAKP